MKIEQIDVSFFIEFLRELWKGVGGEVGIEADLPTTTEGKANMTSVVSEWVVSVSRRRGLLLEEAAKVVWTTNEALHRALERVPVVKEFFHPESNWLVGFIERQADTETLGDRWLIHHFLVCDHCWEIYEILVALPPLPEE
ncbi:MAG TPA: hypothetical protein VNK70_01280 [Candidatus Paceibacterota bacterium]|nr:hypothetical protein [Candidatus Paceibacterota bacterium]